MEENKVKTKMLWSLLYSIAEEDQEVSLDSILDMKSDILKGIRKVIKDKSPEDFVELLIGYDVFNPKLPCPEIPGLLLRDKAFAMAQYILLQYTPKD